MKPDKLETSLETLINSFERLIPLNKEEKELVNKVFHPRLFRKRQYVLQEGDVCTRFNFVVRRCLRSYNIDEKGNIYVLQFAAENNWINDLGSFHNIKPSTLNIDALEDTEVFQISLDDLIALYTQASKFHRIFRVLVENAFIRLQERLLQNIVV